MHALRLAAAGTAAALSLLVGACGDDGAPVALSSTTTEATPRPTGLEEVRRTLADQLDALDMVLTDEGGVVDVDSYEPAPDDGTHLSIYLAPRQEIDPDAYLDGILETARALAPAIFEQWSAIGSFDVCQVPAGDDGDGVALTRLDMDRATVESLDWDALDLPGFLRVAADDPQDGVRLYVGRPVRDTAAYAGAMAAAGLD